MVHLVMTTSTSDQAMAKCYGMQTYLQCIPVWCCPRFSAVQRSRSNSCVYPSPGTRIPPDQRELVPMQIAELLRDIADRQVEPALRQQGLLDRLTGADVQILNNHAALQQQLEGLMQAGGVRNPQGGNLELAVHYWARGLIWAKAILQGLEAAHPSQMEQLQQVLEDALVEVFRKNQLMWWLSNPLSIFTACKNCVGAVVSLVMWVYCVTGV